MPKAIMAVWSDPSDPARDDEYNQWYDSTHVPDVLKIPGFLSATRYRVAEAQFGPTETPARYLAIYEVEFDDLADVPAAMLKAHTEGRVPTTDVIAPGQIVIFEQVTDRQP